MSLYPRWPGTLPVPRRVDYRHDGALPVVRTQMESGRPRVFRYSDVTLRNLSFSIVVSDAQAAQFWAFFDGPANAGADWFYMPVDTANACADHLVRFVGYPSSSPISGDQYQLTMQLETGEQHINWSA